MTGKNLSPAARMRAHMKAAEQAAMKLDTIGMAVDVRKDDGRTVRTVLRQLPWTLGHGLYVAKVDGIAGGYDCSRITPAVEEPSLFDGTGLS